MRATRRLLVIAGALALLALPARAATPLVQYLMADTSMPSTLTDTGPATTVPLTVTAGTGSVASITAGHGINYAGGTAALSGSLSGSKVAAGTTGMSGATAITVEVVLDTTGDPVGAGIFAFETTGIKDMIFLHTVAAANHGGTPTIEIMYNDTQVGFCDMTNGLHVLHVMFDTAQATAANRVLCSIDGANKALDATPAYPAQNTTVDNLGTNYANNRICVGCEGNATLANYVGKIYYAALYASVLSSGVISAHSTSLLANNDADPNGSGSPTVYPSNEMGDASGALTWNLYSPRIGPFDTERDWRWTAPTCAQRDIDAEIFDTVNMPRWWPDQGSAPALRWWPTEGTAVALGCVL